MMEDEDDLEIDTGYSLGNQSLNNESMVSLDS